MKVKVGSKLPNSELFYIDQKNDVKKINILDLCEKKTIILGMPGAFTKTCSSLHLPGYIKNFELALRKGISKIVCISVNDAYSNFICPEVAWRFPSSVIIKSIILSLLFKIPAMDLTIVPSTVSTAHVTSYTCLV